MATHAWLLAAFAASWFMTGLIWFVQVVHYPLFGRVGADSFPDYHAGHTGRTAPVVIVPMAVELVASMAIVVAPPPGTGPVLAWTGLALAALTWASTALVQVPLHHRLAGGADPSTVGRLVATNRARVGFWTAHAAIVAVMVARALAAPR